LMRQRRGSRGATPYIRMERRCVGHASNPERASTSRFMLRETRRRLLIRAGGNVDGAAGHVRLPAAAAQSRSCLPLLRTVAWLSATPAPPCRSPEEEGLLLLPLLQAPARANLREDADALATTLLDVFFFCPLSLVLKTGVLRLQIRTLLELVLG
jgi:hypothetical protein